MASELRFAQLFSHGKSIGEALRRLLELRSEHLLAKGEDQPVASITEQARDQRSKRRE